VGHHSHLFFLALDNHVAAKDCSATCIFSVACAASWTATTSESPVTPHSSPSLLCGVSDKGPH
jgi:hypothetical protein